MFRSTLVAAVLAAAQGAAITNSVTTGTVTGYGNALRFCKTTDKCSTVACEPAKIDGGKLDLNGDGTATNTLLGDDVEVGDECDSNPGNDAARNSSGSDVAYAVVVNAAGDVTVKSFTCENNAVGTFKASSDATTANTCDNSGAATQSYFELFASTTEFSAADAKTKTSTGVNLCMKQADAAACTALTAANTDNCVALTLDAGATDLNSVVIDGKTYKYTDEPEKQICASADDMYFTLVKDAADATKLGMMKLYSCTAGKYLAVDKDGAKADTDGEWSFTCGTTASFLKTGAISTSYMTAASFKTDVKGKLNFCSKTAATDCPTGDALKSACSSATTTDDSFTYKEKAYKVVTTAPTVGAACTEHQATIALKSDGKTAGKAGSMNLFECDSSTSKVKTAVAVGGCTKAAADWFAVEDPTTTGGGDSSNSVIVGSAVAASVTVAAALSTF